LLKHLIQLALQWEAQTTNETFPSIAIISPYKQQIQVINEQLTHVPELEPYLAFISANTVDSFQGQERDIVYISMTRSNQEGNIGFLADIRRMNVAMTRARKKMVVVGDSATLAQLPFYADFISYTESIDAYLSAWELI
jgi:superfamily I DNA and/or RNA helicase